jgi:hypothetical protein
VRKNLTFSREVLDLAEELRGVLDLSPALEKLIVREAKRKGLDVPKELEVLAA